MYLNVCCTNEWMPTQDCIVSNPVVDLNVHIKLKKKKNLKLNLLDFYAATKTDRFSMFGVWL